MSLRLLCSWLPLLVRLAMTLAALNELGRRQLPTRTNAAVPALVSIVRELFVPHASSFTISIAAADQVGHSAAVGWRIEDALGELLRELPFIKVRLMSMRCVAGQGRQQRTHTDAAPASTVGDMYNLLIIDSVEQLSCLDPAADTANSDLMEYYLVHLVTGQTATPDIGSMRRIFGYFWTHELPNVSLVCAVAPQRLQLYTFYVFSSAASCRRVEMRLINACNASDGRWQRNVSTHIFPDKLSNFNGCPLRIAVWHIPPYMITEPENGTEVRRIGGFEGAMVKVLAKHLNFNLALIVPPDLDMRGRILPNGSLTGAIKLLHRRQIDLAVGCFRHTLERQRVLTSVLPYYQTAMTYCVLPAVQAYQSLEILSFPFDAQTWLCLAATMLLNLVVGSFLYRLMPPSERTQRGLSVLRLFSMFLGLPLVHEPTALSGRLFALLLYFYGLLIRTAYQSLLFQLLQTNLYRRPPRTLADLGRADYSLLLTFNTFGSVSTTPEISRSHIEIVVTKEASDLSVFEFMETHAHVKLAGITPQDFLSYYVMQSHKQGLFYVLPEIVFSQHITMYFPKHSYLVARFNTLLLGLRDFGLIDYWAAMHTHQSAFQVNTQSQAKRLTLHNASGIFAIYLILMAVAFHLFLLELLWRKWPARWACDTFAAL